MPKYSLPIEAEPNIYLLVYTQNFKLIHQDSCILNNRDSAELLSFVLELAGARVVTAASVGEAIASSAPIAAVLGLG